MRPALPRLPHEPLRSECVRRGTTVHTVAQQVGLERQVYDRDGLTWQQADRLACALDLHPSSLWGEDWWAVEEAAERHREQTRARQNEQRRVQRRVDGWREIEKSWWDWRLCRDRIELHREPWPAVA